MAVFLPLLGALLVLRHQVLAMESVQCSVGIAPKLRFSVSSRRNATGHRTVGVTIMEDEAYDTISDAGSELTVEVEQGLDWCNNSGVIITSAQAEAPPTRFRHPDYELFSGLGYYKMHTLGQTWEQARLTCMKEGAHLLVVNSEGEAGVMKQFFARKPSFQGSTWGEHIYIGFSDRATEGQYVTVLGQPLSSSGYTNWASGEPQNGAACSEPDSDCGIMYKGGTLKVSGCSCKAGFICEQEL